MTNQEQEFVKEVIGIIDTLESETGTRIKEYDEIRKYIDGEHWGPGRSNDLPEGSVQSTFNYMQLAVKIHAAKLLGTNSPGEIQPDCPTRSWQELAMEDGVEDIANVEQGTKDLYQKAAEREAQDREDLLREVWDQNNMTILVRDLADNGVGYGDGFILGPIWDEDKQSIRIENVNNPGSVMVMWSGDDYDDMEAIIIKKRYTKKYIEKKWKKELAERNIEIKTDPANKDPKSDQANPTYIPMADVFFYLDDTIWAVIIDKQLVEYTEHNYDFTAAEHFKYLSKSNRPFGKSIIWDGRTGQLDFNETLSNMLTIVKKLSGLKLKGINLPEGYEHMIKGGRTQILPLKQTQNLKQDIEVLQTSIQIWPDDKVLERVKESLLEQMFLTSIDLGAGNQDTPSGYALEVRSLTSQARAKDGRKNLELCLKRLNTNIFKLLEKKVKGAKDIIKGNYSSRIIFPDILPKSATDVINQVSARILSIDSAMKMNGIENPAKEMEAIKSEIKDPIMGPEISKNWQAQMLQAQSAQPAGAEGTNPPGVSQPGQVTPEASNPAQLANENTPGGSPMPMAMPGVQGGSAIMGGQGMINRNNQTGA